MNAEKRDTLIQIMSTNTDTVCSAAVCSRESFLVFIPLWSQFRFSCYNWLQHSLKHSSFHSFIAAFKHSVFLACCVVL